jgi:hypothetical protein
MSGRKVTIVYSGSHPRGASDGKVMPGGKAPGLANVTGVRDVSENSRLSTNLRSLCIGVVTECRISTLEYYYYFRRGVIFKKKNGGQRQGPCSLIIHRQVIDRDEILVP